MSELIKLSAEAKAEIVQKMKMYFREELQQDIGQFDAEFLLDFFSEEVGGYYYNQGITDARAVLQEKLEFIDDALYDIERPI